MKANPVTKCPQCGHAPLDLKMLYYDALVSDMVEAFRYSCPKCNFAFEVKV